MSTVVPNDSAAAPGISRRTQSDVYGAGISGARPAVPVDWRALDAAAQATLSASAGVPYTVSNQASFPLERIAQSAPGAPRLFQLYWSASDELHASLLDRAEASGYVVAGIRTRRRRDVARKRFRASFGPESFRARDSGREARHLLSRFTSW